MTSEEMKELKGLAASMGLYDDRNPCKRAVILGKAIKALEQEPYEEELDFVQEHKKISCNLIVEPCEDVAKAFQLGMALGFGKKYDEMDKVMEEIKKVITQDQQSCEDCISRQAVDTLVDELARAISNERCGISRGRSTATIMRDIRHLPPVNPQPKAGHWMEDIGYMH